MSHEMFLVDPVRTDRETIGAYFRRLGFLVTESGDAREAQGLVRNKFFPIVLVDADIEPWGGIQFVEFVKANSPRSEVILLSSRRSFDVAIGGFRGGAADVIYKDPSEAQRLREQVDRAVRRSEARAAGEASLPAESRAVLDEMLRRLLEMSQKVPATQSRLASMPRLSVRVAVVDHEAPVHHAIGAAANADDGVRFVLNSIPSGGAALDALSESPPDVLAVRDDLMDMPASMLVSALSEGAPDAVAVVYRTPGPDGEATIFEKGAPSRFVRPLGSVADLAKEIVGLCERASGAAAERQLMELFRMEHSDLIHRYATLRSRLEEAIRRDAGG